MLIPSSQSMGMKVKNARGGDELASMGGNHAEDDGAEPEDYAEAIRNMYVTCSRRACSA